MDGQTDGKTRDAAWQAHNNDANIMHIGFTQIYRVAQKKRPEHSQVLYAVLLTDF